MPSLTNINWEKSDEWNRFLELGLQIRTRNSGEEIQFWKDVPKDAHGFELFERGKFQFWSATDGKYFGRIGAFILPEQGEGFIGWYECDRNDAVSNSLFDAAVTWLKSSKCKSILGPINGTTWHAYRFNLTGAVPKFTGEPFQPMYYVDQWMKQSFLPVIFYKSTFSPIDQMQIPSWEEMHRQLQPLGIKLIDLTPAYYEINKSSLHVLLCESFKPNPFFTIISLNTFIELYDSVVKNIPAGFLYALDSGGVPVGIALTYPDRLGDKAKLVVKTFAVHPQWQGKGLGWLLGKLPYTIARQHGLELVVHALMFGQNRSAYMSQKLGMVATQEYAVFEKKI